MTTHLFPKTEFPEQMPLNTAKVFLYHHVALKGLQLGSLLGGVFGVVFGLIRKNPISFFTYSNRGALITSLASCAGCAYKVFLSFYCIFWRISFFSLNSFLDERFGWYWMARQSLEIAEKWKSSNHWWFFSGRYVCKSPFHFLILLINHLFLCSWSCRSFDWLPRCQKLWCRNSRWCICWNGVWEFWVMYFPETKYLVWMPGTKCKKTCNCFGHESLYYSKKEKNYYNIG